MQRIFIILTLSAISLLHARTVRAQSEELQQLILNLEKLMQLKSILSQLKEGYEIVSKGYTTIKDLSQGNFSLHQAFLDGLLQVSPTVRKYKRIADIISMQQQVVTSYKQAFAKFSVSHVFQPEELAYFQKIYSDLLDRSRKDLEELLMVVTSGSLRMNDAERLSAIDQIYADMSEKQQFLTYFNQKTSLLRVQRQQALQQTQTLDQFYNGQK